MYAFGDSFDLYASTSDIQSFWDTYSNGLGPPGLVAGRFSGGQALDMTASSCYLIKASGHNDAVHHLTIAVRLTGSISGATIGTPYISFTDGATKQCSVVFRTDGALLLTSGAYNGTVLDTFLGAVTAQNQWFVFEIEVVVNNTTGSWSVKKNGNVGVPDRTLGSLNTRGGTSNNYANGLIIGFAGGAFQIDDVLWRSDASSVPWVGDIRCYTRMPASDVQKQFTPNTGTTNYTQVNEAHENQLTSYVSDSNVGDSDLYGIASITVTPANTYAVTTRQFAQKSDAVSKSGMVQLKSGSTTVNSGSAGLNTAWAWSWRTDLTDPATSAAWTATGVNNAQVGPTVTA